MPSASSSASCSWRARPSYPTSTTCTSARRSPQQVNNDHALELDAIRQYNEAIVLAGQVLDYATRDILEAILRDEDTHLDELEELQDQIEQMTLPTFLSTQN